MMTKNCRDAMLNTDAKTMHYLLEDSDDDDWILVWASRQPKGRMDSSCPTKPSRPLGWWILSMALGLSLFLNVLLGYQCWKHVGWPWMKHPRPYQRSGRTSAKRRTQRRQAMHHARMVGSSKGMMMMMMRGSSKGMMMMKIKPKNMMMKTMQGQATLSSGGHATVTVAE